MDEVDLSCIEGCDGIWKNDETHLIVDDCDLCGGDCFENDCIPNHECSDCAGVPNGSAYLNDCNDCVIEGDEVDLSCLEGCDGIWKKNGAHSIKDDCDLCDGDCFGACRCPSRDSNGCAVYSRVV